MFSKQTRCLSLVFTVPRELATQYSCQNFSTKKNLKKKKRYLHRRGRKTCLIVTLQQSSATGEAGGCLGGSCDWHGQVRQWWNGDTQAPHQQALSLLRGTGVSKTRHIFGVSNNEDG